VLYHFVKSKFVKCYFQVNLSNLFPVNISGYTVVRLYTVDPPLSEQHWQRSTESVQLSEFVWISEAKQTILDTAVLNFLYMIKRSYTA